MAVKKPGITDASLRKVFRNINKEIRKLDGRTQRGVTKAAQFIRGVAQEKAPFATGNLVNSAFVTSAKRAGEAAIRKGGTQGFKGETAADMAARHTDVMTESKARVQGKEPAAEIGFSAIYALSVHENPRAGKTGGIGAPSPGRTESGKRSTRVTFAKTGEWKFLENALKENTRRVLKIIADNARIPK